MFSATEIPLELLLEAEWNANRMPAGLLAKVRRSIEQFGVVENLVARRHPSREGLYELLSGNHRLRILKELGHSSAPVVVVDLNDARARLLAQALNRTRGSDDPAAYARLLEEVLTEVEVSEVTALLPETESTIERVLREFGGGDTSDDQLPALTVNEPRSKLGEIYQLGPHRLACGDATDPALVTELLAGERPALLSTDPPYGVQLDGAWRDGVRQPLGSARAGGILNDDRADWREAFILCEAPVAYIWHGALHAHTVREALLASGFEIRQQIIWRKQVHALGRGHYQWLHECCYYAVRKGFSANWQGGRKQTTVWDAASPIMPYGNRSDEDCASRHPTQKPLELFERPILNHTNRGEIVYEPFAGSGTGLIAAEKTGRVCLAVELDPVWCDLVRDRYDSYLAGSKG